MVELRKPVPADVDVLRPLMLGETIVDESYEQLMELLCGDAQKLCEDDETYVICENGTPVGMAELDAGANAFLYVNIAPSLRGRGLGAAATECGERMLREGGAERITTTFNRDSAPGQAFAARMDYARQYESVRMSYTGPRFDVPELPVRQYRDEDYPEAHDMYARAFHLMRVGVGDFPDSRVEPPDEGQRAFWARTTDTRMVYELEGEIVGYTHVVDEVIGSISVRPERQGQGIGRGFLRHICNRILEKYDEVKLFCVKGNPARRLYDSEGFRALYTGVYAVKKV